MAGPGEAIVKIAACGICGSDLGYIAYGSLDGGPPSEPFRIGSLENLAAWYFNGTMNQLLVGTTIPTEAERDWMVDKTWAQIVTGMPTAQPSSRVGRRLSRDGNYRGLVA